MKAILDWFEDRTGYREFIHGALYEPIPGGARWRYVWGSTLVFTFMVQLITGLFLWMSYSPSSQTAWESVYYIQHEMQAGWLLRGVHHFTAQVMVLLLAVHLMQVLIDGAYRAPREVNFWLGLILLQIVLGLSLTGYLLPWDQKGYWATQVATKLSAIVPGVGPSIQRLIVGGSTYGHHTLTRFFAMHAGVLPGLLIGFLVLHVYVFRRHGITARAPEKREDDSFWPDQVLKDAVACLAVLMVVLILVFRHAPSHAQELGTLAEQGRLGDVFGAELGAPADPGNAYSAARPEWYFLFLYQFLKYFKGSLELYGAVVIPGAVFSVMFLMPFIGRWKLGHRFNVVYTTCLLIGIGILTVQAMHEDRNDPVYQTAVADAEVQSKRVIELIRGQGGIGMEGARALLLNDPKTHGPDVFKLACSQCHRFDGHDGRDHVPESPAAASDLAQFGTREWIKGFLTDPAGPKYFGATTHGSYKGEPLEERFTQGEMADWSSSNIKKMTPRELDGVVELLAAQAQRADQPAPDAELVKAGIEFFKNGSKDATSCATCHAIKVNGEMIGDPDAGYPQLTGYGSDEWFRDFLKDPGADRHYGERNAMPAFGDRLSEHDLGLLVGWLRREWYEPPAAATAAAEATTE